MKNRAKCKLCEDVLESFHRYDYQVCKCGEISITGGSDVYECAAKEWKNFLRVDDNNNLIVVKTFDKKIDQRVNEKTDESVKEKEDESVKEKADENIQEKTNVNANNKKYIKNQLFEIMKKFIDDIDSLPIHARHQAVTHSDLSAFANVVYSILQAFDDT